MENTQDFNRTFTNSIGQYIQKPGYNKFTRSRNTPRPSNVWVIGKGFSTGAYMKNEF